MIKGLSIRWSMFALSLGLVAMTTRCFTSMSFFLMSKVTVTTRSTFDEGILYEMLGNALEDTAQYVATEVRRITPRDPQRMPKNPNAKVTGNLKRAIVDSNWSYPWVEKRSNLHYIVWVSNDIEYAKYLEFWTKRMAPRSFLRKTMIDKEKQIIDVLNSTFDVLTRKYKA